MPDARLCDRISKSYNVNDVNYKVKKKTQYVV